ncbi:MAG: DUF692 domain-containing protein [Vicinamibacterales bacterium]|nr:DUF692 domain-containing protein [Vicinamibacterales bacterium]
MTFSVQPVLRAGIGLRLPHLQEAVATRPDTGWFEIHPENVLANPHAQELLCDLRRDYPVSLHTVGVSVGSATGLDRWHLARVRELVDRVDPHLVSGHLAWSTHGAEYLNDLLPLPYTTETLATVAAHLHEVQETLARPFLLENPANYLGFAGSEMTEAEFLAELVNRTGCLLLCDVSNVYLSAYNMGYSAEAYLAALPAHAVAELHLGGFTREDDPAGGTVIIDTHDSLVDAGAWDLFAQAVRRFGAVPTLIERDANLPELAALVAEAATADSVLASAPTTCSAEVPCAG